MPEYCLVQPNYAKVYLGSAKKKLRVEDGHHMLPIPDRPWLETEVPGVALISQDFENSRDLALRLLHIVP